MGGLTTGWTGGADWQADTIIITRYLAKRAADSRSEAPSGGAGFTPLIKIQGLQVSPFQGILVDSRPIDILWHVAQLVRPLFYQIILWLMEDNQTALSMISAGYINTDLFIHPIR